MDEFSNKKVEMTQRELTFIKAAEYDKGWRWGLFVTRCTSISSGQSMNLEIFVTENLGLTQITLVNGILVVPVALKR